jgi:5-methylcytosine-specific restriction endonuclease McrA
VGRFKVDSSFHAHPKVLAADISAIGLYARCGSYAAQHLTDGFIPRDVALTYGDAEQVASLVAAGLWVPTRSGWRMPKRISSIPGGRTKILWSAERDDCRQPIPPELREFVFRRDGNRCGECGTTDDLTLDHVHPWSLGGPDTPENLQTLCRSCNSRKGARTQ